MYIHIHTHSYALLRVLRAQHALLRVLAAQHPLLRALPTPVGRRYVRCLRQRTMPTPTHVTSVRRHKAFLFSFRVVAACARFGEPDVRRTCAGRAPDVRCFPFPRACGRAPFFLSCSPLAAQRRRPRRARPQSRASARPRAMRLTAARGPCKKRAARGPCKEAAAELASSCACARPRLLPACTHTYRTLERTHIQRTMESDTH